MKWTSHKVLTGSFIFLCTGNFLSATVALVGSVFPDLVEGVPSNSTSYRKRHRQFSHWFVPYLVFVIFTFILGIKLFFFGIFLNELVLGINGILSIKYISLPYSQYILFGISILIMLSLLLVFVFTKKNISQKSGKY